MSILANSREGIFLGFAQGSRADEFQRATPMLLGQLYNRDYSPKSLLALQNLLDNNFIGNLLLNPEKVVFSHLPLDFAFSAIWWFPLFLLFVTVILSLNLFTQNREFSLLAAIVVLFSPGIMWWSNMPALVLGKLIASGLLLFFFLFSVGSLYVRAIAVVWSGGLATSAFLTYAPLAIGFLITLLPIFWMLLKTKHLNRKEIFRGRQLSMSVFIMIAPLYVYFSERSQIEGLANTFYPGDRSFNSGKVDGLKWIFSGIFDVLILDRRQIVSVNQSEFSLGFGIFIPLVILFVLSQSQLRRSASHVTLVGIMFIQLFWILIPASTNWIPLLSRVSPERMGLSLTISAPFVFFAILLSNLDLIKQNTIFKTSVFISVVLFFVVNSGAYVISQIVFSLRLYFVVFIALWIAIGTWCLMQTKMLQIRRGLYFFAILAFISSGFINPIASQTSPVYGVEPAAIITETPKSAIWASDNFVGDAYLMSHARVSISGQQLTGPNIDRWKVFDQNLENFQIWNKGQSYVLFNWQKQVNVTFREDQPDQINILINPCSPILDLYKVEYLISSKPLDEFECVQLLNEEAINKPNGPMWLYARLK